MKNFNRPIESQPWRRQPADKRTRTIMGMFMGYHGRHHQKAPNGAHGSPSGGRGTKGLFRFFKGVLRRSHALNTYS
jgi:hypothetical protein